MGNEFVYFTYIYSAIPDNKLEDINFFTPCIYKIGLRDPLSNQRVKILSYFRIIDILEWERFETHVKPNDVFLNHPTMYYQLIILRLIRAPEEANKFLSSVSVRIKEVLLP